MRAGASIIGINNRSLHTFEVSLETSIRLLPLAAPARGGGGGERAVSRQGLRLRETRCDAVLMGEVFMTSADPAATLAMLGAAARGGMNRSSHHTCVKVCGLTRLEDAAWAVECGADWLGFIVKANSPRSIAPAGAAAILRAPGRDRRGRDGVSPTPEEALELARACGAARLQLHRVDAAAWPADFPLPCTFGLGVGEDGSFHGAPPPPPPDPARHRARHAGGRHGTDFSLNAAKQLALDRAVMLAGGLDGGNVADAIMAVRPYGVDAASTARSFARHQGPRTRAPLRRRREGV